ncbi:U11/U12 small nuclear ribonucleoprotein 48 kDa protein [Lemmus lemmus]
MASSLGPAHSSQKPARAASSSTTVEAEPPPLEERRRLQEELSEFVESCCRTLEEVTASLGWSLDQLDPGDEAATEDEITICPCDSNHHMPKSSLAKHMESCRLRKLGYAKEEEEEMYNPAFFYENLKIPSVTLNKNSQFQIIEQARTAAGNNGDCYSQIIGECILQCLLKFL